MSTFVLFPYIYVILTKKIPSTLFLYWTSVKKTLMHAPNLLKNPFPPFYFETEIRIRILFLLKL